MYHQKTKKMEDFKINMMGIGIAVVANFIFGFLWFTPIFGKIWGKEMGYDPNEKADKSLLLKGMLSMVIGNFLMAWVLEHNMVAWSFVPDMAAMPPLVSALNSGIFTWLGFYLPVDIGTVFWEKKSWKLFFINTGYHLGMLLIASLILTFL